MKVLLDHNMPARLASLLAEHEVVPARRLGWDRLSNGDLLRTAGADGFDVMVTADKGILYQQNNLLRRIALVVTSTNYLPDLMHDIEPVRRAIRRAEAGGFERVTIATSPIAPWLKR